MQGRHGSCGLVDHTPSHPRLARPSRHLVSEGSVLVGDYAVAQADEEAVDDIAVVAEADIGKAFGKISRPDLVDVVCQMTSILHTRLTVVIALAL